MSNLKLQEPQPRLDEILARLDEPLAQLDEPLGWLDEEVAEVEVRLFHYLCDFLFGCFSIDGVDWTSIPCWKSFHGLSDDLTWIRDPFDGIAVL